jgi:type IV pilus biogenesis protein CpaD/CtpE
MTYSRSVLLGFGLMALVACEDMYPPTPRPNYTIRVEPTASGSVAIPPECHSWNEAVANPLDSQPLPQFGCATARNLASLADNPNDLVEGRTLGHSRAVLSVGAIRRYDNNQTRGLIMPVSETSQVAATSATTATSSMSGDATGSSATIGAATAAP